MSFLHRPQQVLVRRLLFQVHVWTGLATALYAIFIGVTGAALVFRSDLQKWAYPGLFAPRAEGTDLAAPETIIATLEREFPGYRFSGFDYPGDRRGTFLAYVAKGAELRTLFLDGASGVVVGELPHDGWIQQLQELHFTFQAGQPGYVYNGIAASCLLVMCLTGVVVWWPGRSRMRQAFVVHLDRGWRRVVWELHGAAAIWSLVLLIVWAVSGIYFSFPVPFRAATERLMALTPYPSIQSAGPVAGDPPHPSDLLRQAQARIPGAALARFGVPSGPTGVYSVTLARNHHGDGDSSDEVTVYFDRFSGRELATIEQSRQTAGDLVLVWLGRLHVGNFGGWPIKLVWFAAGLMFPLLAVSGTVMWWNRFVRPRRRSTVLTPRDQADLRHTGEERVASRQSSMPLLTSPVGRTPGTDGSCRGCRQAVRRTRSTPARIRRRRL